MKHSVPAFAILSALVFASPTVAQDAPSFVQASAPAPATSGSAAAAEEADPVVCRTAVVRTNSRMQRRGDRRCLRRSEWARLTEANQDRVDRARQSRPPASSGN